MIAKVGLAFGGAALAIGALSSPATGSSGLLIAVGLVTIVSCGLWLADNPGEGEA